MSTKKTAIHFAAQADAEAGVHRGPSLCGSGKQYGTEAEQTVTGSFAAVTCQRCAMKGRAQQKPAATAHWLYRVLETDDEGDPLDFGTISAASLADAQELVTAHLIDVLGDDIYEALPVRFYPVIKASGVWETASSIEVELNLTEPTGWQEG